MHFGKKKKKAVSVEMMASFICLNIFFLIDIWFCLSIFEL